MWVDFLFIAIVLAIAVVDYLTKSIYDIMLVVGALVCYPLLFLFKGAEFSNVFYGALWGFASYGAIFLIAKWIYKDEVFGQGDVLLNAFICGYLGWLPGILTSFLTFFVALLLVVIGWIRGGSFKGDIEIPLAPAMAISAILSLYYHVPILEFILQI